MSNVPTLFLDFDGVLHADPVFLDVRTGLPELDPDLGTLFEWAPILEKVLRLYPGLQIVLSTTWANRMGLAHACNYLPPAVAERVIDRTWIEGQWPPLVVFSSRTRFVQIGMCVTRRNLTNWLAVDNDASGWPKDQAYRLVKTEDLRGLSDDNVQRDLCMKLDLMIEKAVAP